MGGGATVFLGSDFSTLCEVAEPSRALWWNKRLENLFKQRAVLSYEFHRYTNQIQFHKKRFARGVVLKQRQKPTRKWLGAELRLTSTISLKT